MKDIKKQLDIQKQLFDIKKQLYEHRKDLSNELNTIVLSQVIADDIDKKINDLVCSLDRDTVRLFMDNLYNMRENLEHITSYLNQRYNITSREIETLHQIIISDTTSDNTTSDNTTSDNTTSNDITINPEYIEEFEEMLSDGDVPF